MLQRHRTQTLWLPVLATALLAPAFSVAQEFSESDTREIASYVLNDAGLDEICEGIAQPWGNCRPVAEQL